ncbi:HTH-type transcriptional regulator ChbR [compost metagenome]
MAWFGSVRLVDYGPNTRIEPHVHPTASLSLIVDGRYSERIQGRQADHEAGHMLYCPAHEAHAQTFAPVGALQAQLTPTAACLDFLEDALDLSAAAFSANPNFSRLGRRMAAELQAQDPLSDLALEGLALEALTQFARMSGAQIRTPRWLPKVCEFVRVNAARPFSVSEMAAAAGCRPEEIDPAVRTRFGLSLASLARHHRLEMAARLLRADTLSIGAIAADCGFSDQAHLTRAFKAAYGMPPGAFRRARPFPSERSIRF